MYIYIYVSKAQTLEQKTAQEAIILHIFGVEVASLLGLEGFGNVRINQRTLTPRCLGPKRCVIDL